MGDIETLESKIREELSKRESEIPRSEVKLDTEKVLQIIWKNALASLDKPVVYRGEKFSYSVSFSYAEKKDEKGETGVYSDLPQPEEADRLLSMAFNVDGFKGEKDTELQFTGNYVTVTPSREYRHILDFELAVLKKG
ncbi:hypothetical protein OXIME_000824 [Oxyplasma meridianum]|uniref:Uncharacterized protein n=1 Tax=Oxyplasma meridianum TaxID=3073602 RepID=A0AAX4NGE8_9ARCH